NRLAAAHADDLPCAIRIGPRRSIDSAIPTDRDRLVAGAAAGRNGVLEIIERICDRRAVGTVAPNAPVLGIIYASSRGDQCCDHARAGAAVGAAAAVASGR